MKSFFDKPSLVAIVKRMRNQAIRGTGRQTCRIYFVTGAAQQPSDVRPILFFVVRPSPPIRVIASKSLQSSSKAFWNEISA
jgi:hypothetical protein